MDGKMIFAHLKQNPMPLSATGLRFYGYYLTPGPAIALRTGILMLPAPGQPAVTLVVDVGMN
jgi:hypothetical protein